jgi:predicted acylesterase/phospholipase RssA
MVAAWLDDPQKHPYNNQPTLSIILDQLLIRSVVGASAGAMVAMLLAANIAPIHDMTFVSNITLDQYSDFPGWGALLRGDLLETLMYPITIAWWYRVRF